MSFRTKPYILVKDDILHDIGLAISDKQPNERILCFNRQLEIWMWLTVDQYNEQILQFKNRGYMFSIESETVYMKLVDIEVQGHSFPLVKCKLNKVLAGGIPDPIGFLFDRMFYGYGYLELIEILNTEEIEGDILEVCAKNPIFILD